MQHNLRERKSPSVGKAGILFQGVLGAILLASAPGCREKAVEREFFRTGIETKTLADGGVRIIAMARASESAIQSGRIAMKMATCRDAAVLLMRQELSRKDRYPRVRELYRSLSFDLFQGGDYCQLIGFYGRLPEQYRVPEEKSQEILKPGEKSLMEERGDGDLKEFDRKILEPRP